MRKLATLVSAAIGVAGLAASASAATATLHLGYVGSTTATSATGLTTQNLGNAAVQTPAWHHYFEVTITFVEDLSTNQAFRSLAWDATLSGPGAASLAPSTANGTTGGTSQKWLSNNPVIPDPADNTSSVQIFDLDQDIGMNNGDNLANVTRQFRPDIAYTSKVGEPGSLLTPGDRFARLIYTFSGPTTQDVFINVAESPGSNFSWFNADNGNNLNFTTISGGVTSASLLVNAPEPGSLCLLALGGAGLWIGRRRRAENQTA